MANGAVNLLFVRVTLVFGVVGLVQVGYNEGMVMFAGWVVVVWGASEIYGALGDVLNEQCDRTIHRIGKKH
ncbi:hypothetical protein ACVGXN_01240 [Enterobacter hormaechei]